MQNEWRHVKRNLLISNYGGSKEVDNDDGSLFWKVESNFMAFGWAQKFKCGGIYSYGNLKAFIDTGGKFDAGCTLTQKAFYPNLWHNDTLIVIGSVPNFPYRQCWGSSAGHDWDKTQVFNNTIYIAPGHDVMISKSNDCPLMKEKEMSLREFQKSYGGDPGSQQINRIPSIQAIVDHAHKILGDFPSANDSLVHRARAIIVKS